MTTLNIPAPKKPLPYIFRLILSIVGVLTIFLGIRLFLDITYKDNSVFSNLFKVKQATNPVNNSTDTATMSEGLSWTLNFGDLNVQLSKNGSGNTKGTFWQKPIVRTPTDHETIDSLYEHWTEDYTGVVYDTGKNSYYELGPSNYFQINNITLDEFNKRAVKTHTEKNALSSSEVVVINESEEFKVPYTGGGTQWKAIKRSAFHVIDAKTVANRNTWLSDGYTVVCYVPIEGTTSYLAFDEPRSSAGMERNMCDFISNIGIESAEKVSMTKDVAVSLVESLPEVISYKKRVPKSLVEVDHQNDTTYTVHVYEINQGGATATFNWYDVDKSTGKISPQFEVKLRTV